MNDFLLSIFAWDCRRSDGVLAGELDRTSPYRPKRSFKLNLHDSFLRRCDTDRDPARRDPGVAGLFSETKSWNFWSTFPKGERGDRNFLTHPAESDRWSRLWSRRCRAVGVDQSDREEPRKPVGDQHRVAGRRPL